MDLFYRDFYGIYEWWWADFFSCLWPMDQPLLGIELRHAIMLEF